MKRITSVALALVAALVIAPRRAACDNNLLVNRNFQTGNLSGWTVFTTSNGNNGVGLPIVGLFNVTGTGAINAATFEVGQVNYDPGDYAGGGIYQDFTILGNEVLRGSLSADVILTPGAYQFEILIERPYTSATKRTPYQFVTNASASINTAAINITPEPATLLLVASGLFGLVKRKRS